MIPEATGVTWTCPVCGRRVPRSVNACRCGQLASGPDAKTRGAAGAGRGGSLTCRWDDLEAAVGADILTEPQAQRLWDALAARASTRPRFDAAHVAYYGGAVIVLAAMGWLLTEAWDALNGFAVALIAAAYGAAFWRAGESLWRKGLTTPGGLLFTIAVWMTPLAIHGLERAFGLWPQGDPGGYRDYYVLVKGSWIAMEAGTIAVGLWAVSRRPFPFLTFPIAFALWFMSMDLTPLAFGKTEYTWEERRWVSVWFGLGILLVAYWGDLRSKLRQDFAFWGYLFGVLAFWGGLSLMDSGSELSKFLYALINLTLILISVLLRQRVFIVFGALGVLGYLGHLSYRVFDESLLFPIALTMIGVAIIYAGVLYQRHSSAIASYVQTHVPPSIRDLIPPRARMAQPV
jgi:hypothetical protein